MTFTFYNYLKNMFYFDIYIYIYIYIGICKTRVAFSVVVIKIREAKSCSKVVLARARGPCATTVPLTVMSAQHNVF